MSNRPTIGFFSLGFLEIYYTDNSAFDMTTIFGNNFGNTIKGGFGADSIYGYAGNDTLDGGINNDTLIGGTGKDTLTGGEDSDTFIFKKGDSIAGASDKITDFQRGLDRIDVSFLGITAANLNIWIARDGSGDCLVTTKSGAPSALSLIVDTPGNTLLTTNDFVF